MQKTDTSDLTALQWQGIEKLIHVERTSLWPLQRIIGAIFYLTKTASPGGICPKDSRPGKPSTGTSVSGVAMTPGHG